MSRGRRGIGLPVAGGYVGFGVLLALMSCISSETDHDMLDIALLQEKLGVEAGDLNVGQGPNVPPVGRSTFAKLIAVEEGDHLRPEIPYPFGKLLDLISEQSSMPPVGTLFPRGRSLQRKASGDEYYKFPRVVVAVDSPPKSNPTSPHPGLLLADRLFIGYVEPSNQLEIISYNEEMGCFEFEVVSDYRAGGSPKLAYADRSLCLSCHQSGQAPIFPVNPWSETSGGNIKVGEHVREAMAGKSHYFGFVNSAGPEGFLAAARIDDAVERSNQFALINRVWIDGCGRDDVTAKKCRSDLLKLVVSASLGHCNEHSIQNSESMCPTELHDNDLGRDLQDNLIRWWSYFWPTGLKIPEHKIPDRPFESINAEFDSAMSAEFSPLRQRPHRALVALSSEQSSDGLTVVKWLVRGIYFRMLHGSADVDWLLSRADNDVRKLFHALDSLGDRGADILAAKPLQRSEILTAIASELSGGGRLDPGRKASWWKQGASVETISGQEKLDPKLQAFVDYCGRCHLKSIPWLGGEDGTPSWDNIRPFAALVYEKLDWENQAHSLQMPPANTLEFRRLEANPELRESLKESVKALLNDVKN